MPSSSHTALESVGRPGPSPVVDGSHLDVALHRRDPPEEQRKLEALDERVGEARHMPQSRHIPLRAVLGDVLEMGIPAEQSGHRLRAEARQPRKAIGAVAHQREVVGDRRRPDAELLPHSVLVDHDALAPIELHDPRAGDALAEILVGRAEEHLVDSPVLLGDRGRSRHRVIGLELDHRPHGHAHRIERVLEHGELSEQLWRHPCTRLVARPQVVAKRFDDVVGRDADMCGAVLEESEGRSEDTDGRAERSGFGAAEVLPEELVGAVDEMDVHARQCGRSIR